MGGVKGGAYCVMDYMNDGHLGACSSPQHLFTTKLVSDQFIEAFLS